MRRLLPVLLTIASLSAADRFTEYRSGPFRVWSSSGDRTARERLNELEQTRHVLGGMLGKSELDSVWPVYLILFPNAREYGSHALPQPFVPGGSAMLSAWSADLALPLDWRRELVRRLIEDNAARMPDEIETALGDLFSTIQVNGTRITLGAAPPQGSLAANRLRAWAKVQFLATQPEYAGRFRIFLTNLQQTGEEAVAVKNAYDLPLAELEKRIDTYVSAGKWEGAPVSGRALNPNRDFVERAVAEADQTALLEELKSAGKTFPPDSPRGNVAKNTRPALELAIKANPKWAEPHFRLAALETTSSAKIRELKAAAALAQRNTAYWQALAEAQVEAQQFTDAAKSWALAERAAASPAEREKIHQTRREIEERRTDFEIAERKRQADERAAELQGIKDAAAAEIHAAEEKANREQGGLKSPQAPVAWWDDESGTKVSGQLMRVDCLAGSLKLTVQPEKGGPEKSGPLAVLVRDPQKLTVRGANEASFACGPQRPPRNIRLIHDSRPDAKLGTEGDVRVVEFP